MNLSDDDVRDILRLLDSLPFGELRLETDGFRLWLRRSTDGEWTQATQVLSAPDEITPTPTAPPADDNADDNVDTYDTDDNATDVAEGGPSPRADAAAARADAGAERAGLLEVRAPLLGTFYRAPRPGADPFVEVGSVVEEDTVVGIIETMKLMNSVPAGIRGTVVEICVDNAEFTERDAVLMLVAPETQ